MNLFIKTFLGSIIDRPEQINLVLAENNNFFSVDVIERQDGVKRIVEIGDGQVSDLVGWTMERFIQIWS
ncbi:MAG: ATP-grasp domain-containing protein [Pleurocapsa sp.]